MKRQYISYNELNNFLMQAMADHPNLIRLQTIGYTHEKRPISMVTLSQDVSYAELKPALLYTGTIHAREWVGMELAVNFIKYILDNYTSNPTVIQALTRNTLYMVPCLNPDGFEYSRKHFSFWRKNRRDNGDGTFGVDLNRNFDVHFKKSTDTRSNVYGGPSAFSEPETQAIKQFVESHSNITTALDYHSQGNVFFPAHKFNHEAEIEGTDLNILCANMANEIYRVTGRKYGIHRGKPPANLIHGSGREYYYDRGILAIVVEVGTRNIPDYLTNMSQSVDENIPAVLYALNNAINYSHLAPKRPESFTIEELGANQVTLTWADPPIPMSYYYEIYRSEVPKFHCTEHNRIAVTADTRYTDKQLKSGQRYYYNLRKVDRLNNIKSPFAPELKLKTLLDNDELSYTLFPQKNMVGYVGELTREKNADHFGYNSLFIGVNKTKGICYGVIDFDLFHLPEDSIVKHATFSLYPMNRVGAKIEDFGEWSVSILDHNDINDITSYAQISSASPIQTLGDAIGSDQLAQGIWHDWAFSEVEKQLLQKQLSKGRLLLRIQGPATLPMGNDSQMMQFDIGYGRFGGDIHYRPSIEIIYTKQPKQLILPAIDMHTISKNHLEPGQLQSGFDADGNVVFGQLAFSLAEIEADNDIVITQAHFVVNSQSISTSSQAMRFTVELAELDSKNLDYHSVRERNKIEYLGYEVSSDVLKNNPKQTFMFDTTAKQHLETSYQAGNPVYCIIRATSASRQENALVNWHTLHHDRQPHLVIEYIERRKQPLPTPEGLTAHIENGCVKLEWSNPEHPDFVGSYVVRNSFHPPKSPQDGVKLYAGKDGYTYDRFGNANVPKYYSVFSYDDVPNYSSPTSLLYSTDEIIPIELDEFEAQDDVEMRYREGN